MSNGWFIAGTDTGVGKTFIAELILEGLNAAGVAAVGMKPVASGCRDTAAGVRSDDAERLLAASCAAIPYEIANPFAFVEPVAPHIAADTIGRPIDIGVIDSCYQKISRIGRVVVEGVGGWRVPIGPDRTMADVAAVLRLPIVLVVGVRLGCINHAMLTAGAIAADDLELAGWVANTVVPDMARHAETIAAIEQRLGAPPLATIPFLPPPASRRQFAQTLAARLVSA